MPELLTTKPGLTLGQGGRIMGSGAGILQAIGNTPLVQLRKVVPPYSARVDGPTVLPSRGCTPPGKLGRYGAQI